MAEEIIEDRPGDIVVDDKGEVKEPPHQEAVEEDERPVRAEDDHHEDEQAADGESEEDAEERRQRNRARRAENKNNRKAYIDSLRREIAARDELLENAMQRLNAVEKRTHGADLAAVDSEMHKAVNAYNYFKQRHADAVTAADGDQAIDAMEKMNAARAHAEKLHNIKQAAQQAQRQPQQQPLDPRMKVHAESWLSSNDWYDPSGGDADSQIMLTIDQQLVREGWNPTTPQYWEELDARGKKYLPHRYGSGYNKSQGSSGKPRSAPVAGSGRETANVSNGGYRLSAERVQAIKDAGAWEDPTKRQRMIKAFQNYDKQAGA